MSIDSPAFKLSLHLSQGLSHVNVNQIMKAQEDTKVNQHYCYFKVISSKVNLGFLVLLHGQVHFIGALWSTSYYKKDTMSIQTFT